VTVSDARTIPLLNPSSFDNVHLPIAAWYRKDISCLGRLCSPSTKFQHPLHSFFSRYTEQVSNQVLSQFSGTFEVLDRRAEICSICNSVSEFSLVQSVIGLASFQAIWSKYRMTNKSKSERAQSEILRQMPRVPRG
jgi:hypothetical protein